MSCWDDGPDVGQEIVRYPVRPVSPWEIATKDDSIFGKQKEKENCLDAEEWLGTAPKKPGEEPKAAQAGAKPGPASRLFQPFVEKLNEMSVGIVGCVLAGQRDALATGEFKFAAEDSRAIVNQRDGATPPKGTKKPDPRSG